MLALNVMSDGKMCATSAGELGRLPGFPGG